MARAFNTRTGLLKRMGPSAPQEVADGVWIVRGGFPLKTMNVYFVRDGDGVLMFDAGVKQMTKGLATAGAALGGITRIVLGHAHPDHRGAAPGIDAPVYCPGWLPDPLTGQIGGRWNNIDSVGKDRSYLIGFVWQERAEEIHINLRGYPGVTKVPTCRNIELVGGKKHVTSVPCFADSRGEKTVGGFRVTTYTVNQDADQWHLLLAWRHRENISRLLAGKESRLGSKAKG